MASGIRLPWATRLPISTWAGLKALAETLEVGQGDVVTLLVEKAMDDLKLDPAIYARHYDRIVSGEVANDGPKKVQEARANLERLASGDTDTPLDQARKALADTQRPKGKRS